MKYKGKAHIATVLYVLGMLAIGGGLYLATINLLYTASGVIFGMLIIGFAAIIDLLIILIDEIRNQNSR
jgi:hypothetical protein